MSDWGVGGCLQASVLEIYNEELRDLLGKGPPAGSKLQVCSYCCSNVPY